MNNDLETQILSAKKELQRLKSFEPYAERFKMCPKFAILKRDEHPFESKDWITWDRIYQSVLSENSFTDDINKAYQLANTFASNLIETQERLIQTLEALRR